MIIFQVVLKIKDGQLEAFKAACAANGAATIKEAGNQRFEVYQDSGNEAIFLVMEAYDSETAQQAHYETEHFKTWRETTQDMIDNSGFRSLQRVFPA